VAACFEGRDQESIQLILILVCEVLDNKGSETRNGTTSLTLSPCDKCESISNSFQREVSHHAILTFGSIIWRV
jgi:hypothetical protein